MEDIKYLQLHLLPLSARLPYNSLDKQPTNTHMHHREKGFGFIEHFITHIELHPFFKENQDSILSGLECTMRIFRWESDKDPINI